MRPRLLIMIVLLAGSLYVEPTSANPVSFNDYAQQSVTHINQNRLPEAIADCNAALAIKTDLRVLYNRGLAYASLGNYQEAIKDYTTVLRIDGRFADAYSARGRAYMALGNHLRANRDLSKAIQLNPKEAETYFLRALNTIALHNGSPTDAEPDLKRTERLTARYDRAIAGIREAAKKAKPAAVVMAKRPAAPSAQHQDTPGPAQMVQAADTDLNQQFFELVANWLKMKNRVMRDKDGAELEQVLAGKALERTRNSVAWLRDNHQYYSLKTRMATIREVEQISGTDKYSVAAAVEEAYELIDERTHVIRKRVDDINEIVYTIRRSGNRWVISDSRLLSSNSKLAAREGSKQQSM